MVNAFVISPRAEKAIFKQLDALERQDQTSSSIHRIESDEDVSVHKNSETIPAQTSLTSQVTQMMQKMEMSLQTFVNERLIQSENNFQTFFNERLATLENKISEITQKTTVDTNIQGGAKDYNNKTVPELKLIAKERKIKRYSSMRKAELIDALEESDMTT
ncbi:Rho termination factor N-terminal domain-containing protein [Desulfobacter latus]|uniref:Rho termination factor N-terminal domain-containing protein n=2 Tax=Desulfobacter latus TaxID=2292 RepID=A0A850T459_9BACT|nr:Rho termination factor N-terminal domain-containing protein [Desulfobacter latus]